MTAQEASITAIESYLHDGITNFTCVVYEPIQNCNYIHEYLYGVLTKIYVQDPSIHEIITNYSIKYIMWDI